MVCVCCDGCMLTMGMVMWCAPAEDDRRFVLFNVQPKNFDSFEEKQEVGLLGSACLLHACSSSMPYYYVICAVVMHVSISPL